MPEPDKSEKRRHIVETAYVLFREAGFRATGIDRIIAEADVAKMTMYRHFPSKDDLIVAVLAYRAARFERQLDRMAETATTPFERIQAIFDWHERWFQSRDFHGCLFQHALAEYGDPGHPVARTVAAQKDGFKHRLQQIVAEILPAKRAERAGTAIFMMIEGATLLAQMGAGPEALGAARDATVRLLAASEPGQ